MKFVTVAVAAAIAISTTSATVAPALPPCDIAALFPIATSANANQCQTDSGFSLIQAAITEIPPTQAQYPAICASKACMAVLQELYTLVPQDCAIPSGKSVKSLTDPVNTACNPLAPCDIVKLFPIVNGADATQCQTDSGFSLVSAAITELPPTPAQYPAICASKSCKSVLAQLYAAVPTDCKLSGGKQLKSLTEPVKKSCKA